MRRLAQMPNLEVDSKAFLKSADPAKSSAQR
jgi:hypothetical protein